jgi:hypothetical protein
LRRKTKDEIIRDLKKLGIEEHDGNYDYLIKMPMDSVSKEKVTELENQHQLVEEELEELTGTTIEVIWMRELTRLKKCI